MQKYEVNDKVADQTALVHKLIHTVFGNFHIDVIWASSRENLSSGFPTKRVSNQSPQLQRLARKLKFHL